MAKVIRQSGKVKEALQKAVDSLGDKSLEVGFFETARYKDGTPIAGVAAVQEFGSPVNGIPPRSFMRTTAEEKQGEWSELIAQGSKDVINGSESPESMLEKIGLRAAGNIRTKITQITAPALSPVTLHLRKLKQNDKSLKVSKTLVSQLGAAVASGARLDASGVSTKPLIDSGDLVAAVTHRVK